MLIMAGSSGKLDGQESRGKNKVKNENLRDRREQAVEKEHTRTRTPKLAIVSEVVVR